ncbi:MAG: MFS transporter [Pseudomonadota bacterium]|nr:MFS transporter [Pseudomonadota bacterium]
MFQAVAALSALLLAAAILLTGNGLQSTLISVRAGLEHFPTTLIGVQMSAYFAGFVLGCRINPSFIKSVGHIRTFVALASIASASALAHAIVVNVVVWPILRAVTGFCFAGLFMIIESWINERATNSTRGRILSVYRIVDLLALTAGNALLTVASPASFELFALISILISLALVPVALTRSPAPKPIQTAKLDIPRLYAVSPAAAIAAPMGALANAAFWAMAPVYVQRLGHGSATIAAFMSAAIIGAALLQWPLGWLSDRMDRRKVMVMASLAGALSAFSLAQFGATSTMLLLVFGFLVGAFIIPMFGLAAAHANDHADSDNAVATNGGLLLLHGCGSVIGATIGGVMISIAGPSSLFDYIGSVYVLLAGVCLYRILMRAPAPDEKKAPFVPVPKSAAPTVFEIAQEEAEEGEPVPAVS